MLIYKQELPNNMGIVEVDLNFENAEEARKNILHLELQYDLPHMWFNALREKTKKFIIVCIGTGHDWGNELLREEYIGSLVVAEGMFVWHYFLVDREQFIKRVGK